MKIGLCAIGRLENRYAVEFVEWYKSIGFNKIFIYDNNHDGEEHFEDVLQSYIVDGFVEITNFRNKNTCQLNAYTDCYNKHKDEYDWLAFFDFDEYLILKKDNNIQSFLSRFKDFQCVKINWMVYTDNDLVRSDYRPLNERFTEPMEYDKCVQYSFPENNHVKSIIRCDIEDFEWNGDPHIPTCIKSACNANGEKSNITAFQPYDFDVAYLKHFITKTIEEWLSIKFKRGTPDVSYDQFISRNKNRFFKYNKKTEEKEKYLNDIKIDIFIGTQKTFEPKVTNDVYKIIVGNHEIENKSNLELINCKHDSALDDRFYSEIYMLDYISKNYPLKDYVGFCHNRRYFNFLDDIPDMDELLKNYDVIVAKPLILKYSMKEQYKSVHNLEDLYIIGGIIADKYPGYTSMWHNFINGKIFIPYNMFIMRKEDFQEYIKFIMDILDEYLKIIGTDINKRIYDNYEKYIKDLYPNNTVEYQYRIGGYLGERLTNLFLLTHFKKIKTYPVIVTEDKYKQKG